MIPLESDLTTPPPTPSHVFYDDRRERLRIAVQVAAQVGRGIFPSAGWLIASVFGGMSMFGMSFAFFVLSISVDSRLAYALLLGASIVFFIGAFFVGWFIFRKGVDHMCAKAISQGFKERTGYDLHQDDAIAANKLHNELMRRGIF